VAGRQGREDEEPAKEPAVLAPENKLPAGKA
jgi:hypothetical protein